jgi:hypothetical protein
MLRTYARAFVLSVIPGNRRRSPDSSRQLTLSAEDGADRGGIGLGDDEHPKSMVTCRLSDKRGVAPGQGSVTTITSACWEDGFMKSNGATGGAGSLHLFSG